MTKKQKRLERMATSPLGDWTIDDVQAVCDGCGLTYRHDGGSHCTVSHPSQPDILTIPAHRPIKPYYIKQLVKFVGRVTGSEEDD